MWSNQAVTHLLCPQLHTPEVQTVSASTTTLQIFYEINPEYCSLKCFACPGQGRAGGWMKVALFFRKLKYGGIHAQVTYWRIWYQSVEQTERICWEDIRCVGCSTPLIPQLHNSNYFPTYRIQNKRRQESCKKQ